MIHRLTDAEKAEARAIRRPDLQTINSRTGMTFISTGFTRQLEKAYDVGDRRGLASGVCRVSRSSGQISGCGIGTACCRACFAQRC